MAKLIFEGDIKQLKIIASTQSGRAKKYGVLISLTEDKKGDEVPPSVDDPKTAKDVIALIEICESDEDLKVFESDNRQLVVAAYKKKLKSFE